MSIRSAELVLRNIRLEVVADAGYVRPCLVCWSTVNSSVCCPYLCHFVLIFAADRVALDTNILIVLAFGAIDITTLGRKKRVKECLLRRVGPHSPSPLTPPVSLHDLLQ